MIAFVVRPSRFQYVQYVVTPSYFRTGLDFEQVQSSGGGPFPSEPVHEVRKPTLNSCHYVHPVRTRFEPVVKHFKEHTENEFGVTGVL